MAKLIFLQTVRKNCEFFLEKYEKNSTIKNYVKKKHTTKKWEVSMTELKQGHKKIFMVTRRIPELTVAETKFFYSRKRAMKQFEEWLH